MIRRKQTVYKSSASLTVLFSQSSNPHNIPGIIDFLQRLVHSICAGHGY